MDHDYVVRKQVQNRAIVREVDEARQRDLLRTVLGGALRARQPCCSRRGSTSMRRRLDREAVDARRASGPQLREVRRHLELEKAHAAVAGARRGHRARASWA